MFFNETLFEVSDDLTSWVEILKINMKWNKIEKFVNFNQIIIKKL